MNVQNYGYKRENIQSGILHIGVGNFHRAHQAFYADQLLKDDDQSSWGICGVCLLPSDENIIRNLRSQDLKYTLTVCGRNGQDEIYQIGALNELLWAIENPIAVLDKIADPAIKIITLTITEGGYNLDKVTGDFMLKDEKIQQDLHNPSQPTTVFGFVAEGLRRRRANGSGSITILSCDNLQHNGNTARSAFSAFITAQDKELAEWVMSNVTFPNSMVDRITPATKPEDIERLNLQSGVNDLAPVYCEDFIQWVIEDNFIAGRPDWERTGVEFTTDVSAFENMKLSLLNASHTLLSYPSLLKGYRKVDEAMQDQDVVKFVRDFMDLDITPHVPAPAGTNLETYKQTLIERFANRSVSDQLSRLCFDGISKFPVYVMPNLKKMIGSGQDTKRLAFLFAAYRHYLKYKEDDNNVSFEVAEPWLSPEDEKYIESDNPVDFLSLSAFKSTNLKEANSFVELYVNFVASIKQDGVSPVLADVLS
jgi:mannitol 2-dehydrogenase